MTQREFNSSHSMTRAGVQWFCQTAGTYWATRPEKGWYLFLTDGPSWYLMGNGWEVNMGTHRLKEAMDYAAQWLASRPTETETETET